MTFIIFGGQEVGVPLDGTKDARSTALYVDLYNTAPYQVDVGASCSSFLTEMTNCAWLTIVCSDQVCCSSKFAGWARMLGRMRSA